MEAFLGLRSCRGSCHHQGRSATIRGGLPPETAPILLHFTHGELSHTFMSQVNSLQLSEEWDPASLIISPFLLTHMVPVPIQPAKNQQKPKREGQALAVLEL